MIAVRHQGLLSHHLMPLPVGKLDDPPAALPSPLNIEIAPTALPGLLLWVAALKEDSFFSSICNFRRRERRRRGKSYLLQRYIRDEGW